LRFGGDLTGYICRVPAKFRENPTIRVTKNPDLVIGALQCAFSRLAGAAGQPSPVQKKWSAAFSPSVLSRSE
jgi:hypothetical protein